MKLLLNVVKKLPLLLILLVLVSCGGKEERKAKYLEKGKVYLEDKNYDKARIEFRNVVQIDPKYPEVYFFMGRLEEEKKELGSAVGNYKKAIELDDKYAEPKVRLARLYSIIGTEQYLSEARELIDQVLAADKENNEAKLVLSIINYRGGDKEKALKDIESLVADSPLLVEGVSLLAANYDTNDQYAKAIGIIEKTTAMVDDISLEITVAK